MAHSIGFATILDRLNATEMVKETQARQKVVEAQAEQL